MEDYVKAEMAGGDVVLTEKQEVNGMEWTMVNRAGGYYEWITSNKGKMYEVRFRDKRTEDEVGVDMVNYVRKTVTEAAKRIQFN